MGQLSDQGVDQLLSAAHVRLRKFSDSDREVSLRHDAQVATTVWTGPHEAVRGEMLELPRSVAKLAHMHGPNPDETHPMEGFPQVCFIKNTIKSETIHVGDYTYYDDPENSEDFERNVLYHFPFIGDRLVIGKFCAIGRGVRFIMNGANHKLTGLSTFPFFIFGKGWEKVSPGRNDLSSKGDTVVENDVWLGYESLIMPGVRIGNGAIVAARSVVTKDVPAYSIVGGNPAQIIKMRFDEATVDALQEIAWWNWSIEKITTNLPYIVGADLEALQAIDRGEIDPKSTRGFGTIADE